MTIDRMTLKALVEKGSDDDLLREMMSYVANRMMDLEVESLTGARTASGRRHASPIATATASAPGKRARARSTWRSPSSGRAATFRPSWSHAGPARRR
jgi:hypothetical protein